MHAIEMRGGYKNGILLLVNGEIQTVLDCANRLRLTPSYNNVFDILKMLSAEGKNDR